MEFLDKVLSVDTLDKKPSVIFLPGHLFFVKSLDLPQGMARSELNSFVEISLEEQAPFPVQQLYYGSYYVEGSKRVLIYAAYHKRFTPGEREVWEDADLVVPDFVSLFGQAPSQPELHLLVQEGTVSAVYFDGKDPVPAEIASRGFEADLAAEEKHRIIDDIIGRFQSGGRRVNASYFRREGEVYRQGGDLHFPVVPANRDGTSVESGGAEQRSVDRSVVSTLDVREKDFLAAKRKTATRDAWLWRSAVGIAALVILLALGELVLYAASSRLADREELVENRVERVARIQEQLELAQRLEELGENQLLPFEMLAILNEHRPHSMHFTAAQTEGWNGLIADVVTANTRDVNEYENALRGSGNFENVTIRNQRVRDGQTTFILEATFNSGALRAAAPVAQTLPARSRGVLVTSTESEVEREGTR